MMTCLPQSHALKFIGTLHIAYRVFHHCVYTRLFLSRLRGAVFISYSIRHSTRSLPFIPIASLQLMQELQENRGSEVRNMLCPIRKFAPLMRFSSRHLGIPPSLTKWPKLHKLDELWPIQKRVAITLISCIDPA